MLALPRENVAFQHPSVLALEALDSSRLTRPALVFGPLCLRADRIEPMKSGGIEAMGDVIYRSQAYDMTVRASRAVAHGLQSGEVEVAAEDVTGVELNRQGVLEAKRFREVLRADQ